MAADKAVISNKNGAVIETIQEYFSDMINDSRKENNGKATERIRQTSKKIEYDMLSCKPILLTH